MPHHPNTHSHSHSHSHHHQPTPNQLCIHFYTFGQIENELPTIHHPIIDHVQCKHLHAPPSRLCDSFTGLDRVLSDYFFSDPRNEDAYRKAIDSLLKQLNKGQRLGRCLAVLVSCRAGMHRSVAMAERMAGRVVKSGFRAQVRHLDLEEGVARRERDWKGKVERERAAEKKAEREKAEDRVARKKVAEEKAMRDRLAWDTVARDRLMRENESLVRENERLREESAKRYRSASQDATRDNSIRRQVTVAPRPRRSQPVMESVGGEQVQQYYGKPAPSMAAAYRFIPHHGWVPKSA